MPDGVQIDTDEVNGFANQVRGEAAGGLTAAMHRGRDLHRHGVVFGANFAGGSVLAAKTRYAEALSGIEANLRAYVEAARVFADAAERIATEFAGADAASADAQRKVEQLLNGAVEESLGRQRQLGPYRSDVRP